MSGSIFIDKNLSLEEQYAALLKQVKSLLVKEDNILSNLSNLSAALKEAFDKISWVGFYLYDGTKLYLGPFQGKVACTNIEIGKGVCGTSAKLRKTVVVQDVEKFPGHIACDPGSRSEIVIPMIKDNNLFGVLDVDSAELNSFNSIDRENMEAICNFLTNEIL